MLTIFKHQIDGWTGRHVIVLNDRVDFENETRARVLRIDIGKGRRGGVELSARVTHDREGSSVHKFGYGTDPKDNDFRENISLNDAKRVTEKTISKAWTELGTQQVDDIERRAREHYANREAN